jgi:hypothetical protein
MLSIDEQGNVSAVNQVVPAAIRVPHRREVLAALRSIKAATAKRHPGVIKDLQIICEFLGCSLDIPQSPSTNQKGSTSDGN